KGEPYVIAADIYRLEGQAGPCGWTWDTGSNGGNYRVWLEDGLGFKPREKAVRIAPAIPESLTYYSLGYRYQSSLYEILVENPEHVSTGVVVVELDGTPMASLSIPLVDDGNTHKVRVQLGKLTPEDDSRTRRPSLTQDSSVPVAS